MAARATRRREKDSLARFLGWFSLGLGTAQLLAPRQLCRLVGASGGGASARLMRLIGARELAQGLGILARPRPTFWLWSRVAGDGVDLALLALTAARNPDGRRRTGIAIAGVAAVAVPDVLEGRRLARKHGPVQKGKLVRKAVTVNRAREEVERAWAAVAEPREKVARRGATVSFSDAPGARGTELAVELVEAPPLGDLGATVSKLAGKDLASQLSDDLRRFKQLVETGELARSDSTPEGHLLADHLKQRAAQPREEVST